MKETDIIDRGFLIELRRAAEGMAAGNLNPAWVRAYLALADAADRLDAMQSRSSIPPQGGWDERVPAVEPTVIDIETEPVQTC